VNDQALSSEERVAKMLVDHWIDFKGCKRHTPIIGGNITGMKEFVDVRQKLLQKVPEFADPDFAQVERLPEEARLLGDRDEDIEDEWRKLSNNSLCHMTTDDWKECHEIIGRVFTGGDDSDDEEGIKLDRYLEVGKDDVVFADSQGRREMARGEATLDVDSVLALFTDLSMINTEISISIIANPMKNLKKSVHIIHDGAPLHLIPHFHLGHFGHNVKFDLFIFLPELYNKDLKRRKNNLFNHVSEELRAEFMDKCLLPAIKGVLKPNEGQSWDFNYMLSQAKSNAVGLEGIQHKSDRDNVRQYATFDLDDKDIGAVWNDCNRRLCRAIRQDWKLRAFKGFQFFINSKGHKHRTYANGFPELMRVYKEKV
jgi:hypothetical protein